MSNEVVANRGVPQGSKFGPILFIMYANDMVRILNNSTTFAYADDTAIVVTHKNINTANKIMQNQLDLVAKWCHDNGLVINASKTKLMHIKPTHLVNVNLTLKFHSYDCLHLNANKDIDINDHCDTYIDMVSSYKYLGVYVDQNFKWKTHIDHLQKKLRSVAFTLFHLSSCATTAVLRQAYFSLAESYLRHGVTAWGTATYCRSLQNTQNRILKILLRNETHNNLRSNTQNQTYNTNGNTNATQNQINPPNSTNNNNTVTRIQGNIYNNSCNNITDTSQDTNNNGNNQQPRINNTQIQQSSSTTNYTNITNDSISRTTKTNTKNNIHSKEYSLAKHLNVLTINNIYNTTLINEFSGDMRFLNFINHTHNT